MGLRQDESDRINEQVDSLLDRTKKRDNPFTLVKNAENNGNAPGDTTSENKSLKEIEENIDEPRTNIWANNVTGKDKINRSKSRGVLSFVKKKGPLTTIILTLIGGGFGIGGLLSPALLTQSILANIVQKFNTQETSLTIRTNKVIASKMAGEATTGVCTKVMTIACKFTRPSNRFLSQLEKNGITALDAKGNAITKNGLFPNTRPTKYNYVNSAGETIEVEAKNLYQTLLNNGEFRAAFHNAYNPRFKSLTDSIFNSIKARFRFNTNDKLNTATDEKTLNTEINDNVEANNAIKNAVVEGEEAAAEVLAEDLIRDEAKVSVEKMSRAGKASVVNLAAAGVCLVTDIPGLAAKTGRAFQMAQLIKYSMIFLSAFGSIKAGDATPAEVSAIGDTLTKTTNGKSAMDSFGMKYAITGDTKPMDNNFKKFAPGGSTSGMLKTISKVTESPLKKGTCKVAMDWRTGLAIDVALADTWVGIIPAAINAVAGYTLSEVLAKVIPPVLDKVIGFIDIKSILLSFYGDLTQNLVGIDVGEAMVSGASHVMGQTANAGGNMPLTPSDAVAYNNLTKQVQLAYAEEDRATKSPLDASSPNTMMGSIIQQFIPYYMNSKSNLGSTANIFSAMGNMILGSFSTVLRPISANAESADISQYKLCDDPTIKDSGIAAGPYCNIIYGVPTQYLDEEPMTVVNNLITSKDIDEETGNPIAGSDLETWMIMCTDGKTDQAGNCQITDQKIAEYALYTIDHRIQNSMDAES